MSHDRRRHESVLAVDIGGTKIAAAVVDDSGRITSRRRESTTAAGGDALIEQVTHLLAGLRAESSAAIRAVGIGIPAVLEPATDRVLWAPNIPGARDLPLREALESRLGLPVLVEYDGHTAVLGEWWQGAGRGFQNVVFVIIGTGIGGGMILDGRLYCGRDRLAGAAGWFDLTTDVDESREPRQYGHWEALAAGPGIARRALVGLAAGRASSLHAERLTAEYVLGAARAGDAFAGEIINETARIIGIGVANIVSLLNPDVVILGGGVGSQPELLEPVRRVVRARAQPIAARSVRIESSQLGDDAGLLGAAYVALERARS